MDVQEIYNVFEKQVNFIRQNIMTGKYEEATKATKLLDTWLRCKTNVKEEKE